MKLENQYIVLGLIKSGRYGADAANGVIYSNIGRQRNQLKENILPNDYHQVGLDLGYGTQIMIYVHHFIYLHVYGAFDPKYVIDHKDTNTHHNYINNLQCITGAANLNKGDTEHRHKSKFIRPRLPEDAKCNMVLMFEGGKSFAEIAKHYKCARHNVAVIVRNRIGNVSAFKYRSATKMKFTKYDN